VVQVAEEEVMILLVVLVVQETLQVLLPHKEMMGLLDNQVVLIQEAEAEVLEPLGRKAVMVEMELPIQLQVRQ
tara:strand:- start:235 stop:453 length:219 start_codon:yes stop_codon:yes gene_type:complete